eukprot:143240_1
MDVMALFLLFLFNIACIIGQIDYQGVLSPFTMYIQDSVYSKYGYCRFNVQSDGNLALHSRPDNTSGDWSFAGWSAHTGSSGNSVTLQNNGDLVVFDSNSIVLFNSSSKHGIKPFRLVASDDIFGYIIDSLDNIIWITDEKFLWTQIWHDSMDSNSSWIGFNSFSFRHNSNNCPIITDTECAVVRAYNGDSGIEKMTNISQFKNYEFHLELDINGINLENNDYCQVWYQYDNNGWIQYNNNWELGIYTNQMIDIPTSVSLNLPTILWIQLRVKGDSNSNSDKCYFDNVILRGELITTSPTISPTYTTITPTKYPTKSPTKHMYKPNITATIIVYCDDNGNVSVS